MTQICYCHHSFYSFTFQKTIDNSNDNFISTNSTKLLSDNNETNQNFSVFSLLPKTPIPFDDLNHNPLSSFLPKTPIFLNDQNLNQVSSHYNDITKTPLRHGDLSTNASSVSNKSLIPKTLKNFPTKLIAGKKLRCVHCRKRFRSRKGLLNHDEVIHSTESEFRCRICDSSFIRKSFLSEHMWSKHREKSFSCEFCRKSFGKWKNLHVHISRIHDESKIRNVFGLKCRKCEEQFEMETDLAQHLAAVHADNCLVCQFCNKFFSRMRNLKRHKMSLHPKEEKEMRNGVENVCQICEDGSFESEKKLTSHKWIAHQVKSFECQISNCKKFFRNKKYLARHVRLVHRRAKKFEKSSKNVEMKFEREITSNFDGQSGPTILEQIEALSTAPEKSIKKYRENESRKNNENFEDIQKCEENEWRKYDEDFETELYLKRAGPLLQGEDSFGDDFDLARKKKFFFSRLDKTLLESFDCVCKKCGKQFQNLSNLFVHSYVEHEKKSFFCEICRNCFSKRKSLNEHITYVHCSERKWKCLKCEKSFVRKYQLQCHLKSKTLHWKLFFCKSLFTFRI